jgi:hypothetical protein
MQSGWNVTPARIVLTGGPGGGKTTAADLFRRELGPRVAVVPEAATLLYAGGFPRSPEPGPQRAAQMAIFHLQRNLEDVIAALHPHAVLLCDRGTLDGVAYWPGDPAGFLAAAETTVEAELARYDAVIFFETAASAGIPASPGNPYRIESLAQAVELDGRLRAAWARHPRFVLVPHDPSFIQKIIRSLEVLKNMVEELQP